MLLFYELMNYTMFKTDNDILNINDAVKCESISDYRKILYFVKKKII